MPSIDARMKRIRDVDDDLFRIEQDGVATIMEASKTGAYPKSYRAMFSLWIRINALKTALFDMVDSDNPYAFKALFRCLVDHHLKFQYILTRVLQDKTDDVGVEYYSFCGALEARQYADALKMVARLRGGEGPFGSIDELIAKWYPAAASASANELERAGARFKYRAIIRYLGESPLGTPPFLMNLVPLYADLSSFVHGGPTTDRDMVTYSEPKALEDCVEQARIAMLMGASTLMFAAFAMSREHPEARGLGMRLKKAIDSYTQTDGETTGPLPD